jgi:hypothetical protein
MLSIQRNREIQDSLNRLLALLAAERMRVMYLYGKGSPELDGSISHIREQVRYLESLIPSKV